MTEREREKRSACWEGGREREGGGSGGHEDFSHPRRRWPQIRLGKAALTHALRWASGESLPFEIPGGIGLLLSFFRP